VRLRSLAGAACLLSLNTFGAAGAFAAGEDALTELIRHQTDLGSDAGQRGDQATADGFLDDQVLFSGGDGSVSSDSKFDRSDAVSTLLKKRTRNFLDAGQRGDIAAMRRLLDDHALFINEDGVAYGRQNFAGGAPAPPPKGIPSSVSIQDWVLHHDGSAAVSSFVIAQQVRYDGQPLEYKFLTVETWVKRAASWKLMASETIPLHQDPAAVALPAAVLTGYTGTYSAGPGSSVVVSVDHDTILLATNGAKASPLKPEFRDIFFKPGLPTGYAPPRIIFQRDAKGLISGYVNGGLVYRRQGVVGQDTPAAPAASVPSASVPSASAPPTSAPSASTPSTPPLGPLKLRDFVVNHDSDVAVAAFFHDRDTPYYGQMLHQTYRSMETWVRHGTAWKMISSQGRAMQQDPPAATLPPLELKDYLGKYAVGRSLVVSITEDGGELAMSTNHGKPVALRATVRDVFFMTGSPRIIIIFQRDSHGKIAGYISRREERDLRFSKV
jgi:hypothetical protein